MIELERMENGSQGMPGLRALVLDDVDLDVGVIVIISVIQASILHTHTQEP